MDTPKQHTVWQNGAIIVAIVTTLNGAKHWLKDRKERIRVRAGKRRMKAEKRRPVTKL